MSAPAKTGLPGWVGASARLKQQPSLYMGNPTLTVGRRYEIKDVDGSNFVIEDDAGDRVSIGSCRFELEGIKDGK